MTYPIFWLHLSHATESSQEPKQTLAFMIAEIAPLKI